jgi:hypothetical protein
MQSQNTFGKGLNQDNSRSKYENTSYYDGFNIRITSDRGLSTLSVQNEKGNSLILSFPDIPANFPNVLNYKDGSVRTTLAIDKEDLKIVGHTIINDEIVICTTTSSNEEPVNVQSQIWVVKFTDDLESIIGSTANVISLNDLKYNDTLNFSLAHRLECVGRYENSITKNFYFTDNYNDFKSINLALNQNDLALLKPESLNIKQSAYLSLPIITDVGSGNLPTASTVQIAYRLVNRTLGNSMYSFATNPIPLSSFDYKTFTPARKIKGSPKNSTANKSVTYTIKDLDSNFDIIEHIAIVTIDRDAPKIYKFKEEVVPASKQVINTLNGTETEIILNTILLNAVNFGFDVCKTIDIVDNVLVAGNIKSKNNIITDEEFDARAYRFKSDSIALIKHLNSDLPSVTLTGPTPNYDSVPEKHDCYNPYNVQKGVNETVADYNEYKYQVDGSTLGGSGKFISYKFVQEELEGDTLSKTDSSGTNHLSIAKSSPVINLGVKDSNNNVISFTAEEQFKNFKSPIIQHYYTGYMRGEIYRFGIQFIDRTGNPYFVKWVGDIKFPEHTDSDAGNTNFHLHSLTVNNSKLKTLGIQFEVKIPEAIKNKISGFKIVRVQRNANDESRLGTAPIMLWVRDAIRLGLGDVPLFNLALEDNSTTGLSPTNVVGDNNYFLPDRPLNRFSDEVSNSTMEHLMWMSPLLQYGKYYKNGEFINNKENDFLKTTCFLQGDAVEYRGFSPENKFFQLWKYRLKGIQSINTLAGNTAESFAIDNMFYSDSNTTISKNYVEAGILQGYAYANNKNPNLVFTNKKFFSISYINKLKAGGADLGSVGGVGNNVNLIVCKSSSNHNTILSGKNDWNSHILFEVSAPGGTSFSANHLFKEMSYCRKLSGQYKGYSYTDRANQSYISVGHYQILNDNLFNLIAGITNSATFTFKVFGGDTYVNYTAHEYLQPFIGSSISFNLRFAFGDANYKTNDSDGYIETSKYKENGLGVSVIYPTESTINTDLNTGTFQFLSDREGFGSSQFTVDGDNFIASDSVLKQDFVLNDVYQQENNTIVKSRTTDFVNNFVSEFPNRLYPSQKKIDGEFIDSFRIFKDLEYLDVEGNRGPVNKVINFGGKLIFFQDTSFGVGNINEKSLIKDEDGVELVLGKSQQTLDDFKYLSNRSGTKHQFSVNKTEQYIYYFDSLQNKIKRFSGQGNEPLSTINGMSSWLVNNIKNNTRSIDKTLLKTGVHTGIDLRNDRVFFTFLQGEDSHHTLTFNELLNSFESRVGISPTMYINYNNLLMSSNEDTLNDLYLHEVGDYGVFYDKEPQESFITILFNDKPEFVKVFDNILYNSEIKDVDGVDIPDETINKIQIYSDYQDTSNLELTVNQNVVRRLRSWRYVVPRNQNTLERIRDYYVFGKFTIDNTNNRRLVLHDIIMFYRPSML